MSIRVPDKCESDTGLSTRVLDGLPGMNLPRMLCNVLLFMVYTVDPPNQ